MAYIYKIVNDINNKIYIGKTECSIKKRFKEHCRDAFKNQNETGSRKMDNSICGMDEETPEVSK